MLLSEFKVLSLGITFQLPSLHFGALCSPFEEWNEPSRSQLCRMLIVEWALQETTELQTYSINGWLFWPEQKVG